MIIVEYSEASLKTINVGDEVFMVRFRSYSVTYRGPFKVISMTKTQFTILTVADDVSFPLRVRKSDGLLIDEARDVWYTSVHCRKRTPELDAMIAQNVANKKLLDDFSMAESCIYAHLDGITKYKRFEQMTKFMPAMVVFLEALDAVNPQPEKIRR